MKKPKIEKCCKVTPCLRYDGNDFWIQCDICGRTTRRCDRRCEAVAEWNNDIYKDVPDEQVRWF